MRLGNIMRLGIKSSKKKVGKKQEKIYLFPLLFHK